MNENAEAKYEIVCRSPLGVELGQKDCRVLADVVTTRTLGDGDVLCEQGDTDDCLYVVVSGQLAVTRDVGGGTYVTLHVLKESDLAGEMGFVENQERTATLRAIGETEVYMLQRTAFESLIENHPKLVYQVMRAIIRSVRSNMARMNQQFVELSNYITKSYGRY